MSRYIKLDDVIEITAETGAMETQIRAKRLPSIDIEPKRGEWIEWIDCEGEVFWKCSACGQASEASAAGILYKFCPFCGADMRVKEGE